MPKVHGPSSSGPRLAERNRCQCGVAHGPDEGHHEITQVGFNDSTCNLTSTDPAFVVQDFRPGLSCLDCDPLLDTQAVYSSL